MAFISPDDGYLTVLNLFDARTEEEQQRLLEVMRDIIDTADYPGWRSSTLHAGHDRLGTANYIQWRSVADLENRYATEKFRHDTVPLFNELAGSIRLLKTEVVATQRHETSHEGTEITPGRDDYTVIIVFDVEPENQKPLVEALAAPDEWLMTVPGYRSHAVLRGLDGSVVINYAQWSDKAAYDTFHLLPEDQRPKYVQDTRLRARALVTSRWSNTYEVVHTRSANA